jgi:hypothetical protein
MKKILLFALFALSLTSFGQSFDNGTFDAVPTVIVAPQTTLATTLTAWTVNGTATRNTGTPRSGVGCMLFPVSVFTSAYATINGLSSGSVYTVTYYTRHTFSAAAPTGDNT